MCAPALPLAPGPSRYIGRCQIYDTTSHLARQCYYMSASMLASLLTAPPRAMHVASSASFVHNAVHYTQPYDSRDWVVDSGVSHHVTTHLATLLLLKPYSGSDSVFIGDGTGLSIPTLLFFSLYSPIPFDFFKCLLFS